MNYDIIYAILGILGGILTALGDILLDVKGADNETLGTLKIINSNWDVMAPWRFRLSILLGMVGVPFCVLGGVSLAHQITASDPVLGKIFLLSNVISGIGGFFIHTLITLLPIIYQSLLKKTDFAVIDEMVNEIWKAVRIPFVLFYLILLFAAPITAMIAISKNLLHVPMWFLLLNPLVLQLIGLILRKLNKKLFYEIPSIFMASLGLSMYGVIALVHLLSTTP